MFLDVAVWPILIFFGIIVIIIVAIIIASILIVVKIVRKHQKKQKALNEPVDVIEDKVQNE